MLNFDIPRFLRIQEGAAALAAPIAEAVNACLDRGAENLFFLGTGGAGILMQPATLLLRTQSQFPVFCEMPAEMILTGHHSLGAKSLVVIPSLSGTTKESIAILDYARAKGATIIVLTGHADSPLAKAADHAFVNFAEDDTSCESFYLQALFVALAIMKRRGECPDHAAIIAELATLPAKLLEVKKQVEPTAEAQARFIADAPYHIVAGSGATWPEAFYYGMCILEEMQWIRTRPVHASDFFHGTLELVEEGVSAILFKGEDSTRQMVDRAEAFLSAHTKALLVLDTKAWAMEGISPATRALISPILLATALERISAHLEVMRNHPLTTRRYYRKVAY